MSVFYSVCSHGTVRDHAATYHSQKVAVSGMPQHCFCLMSLSRFFDFALGESFHVPSHRLHEGQNCFGRKRQNCFGLKIPEVKVGHALAIVLEHDVAVFGATDKHSPVAGGIVCHGAKLLELLQRDDCCHSALVKPHLFESSK